MGYSVKWVEDNLGITRDMIRYYEEKNLMPKNRDGKYRNYSDEDIEKLWGIKLLIGIGFSSDEIYELINNSEFDFDTAIANKVAELERKRDENMLYLEFAKSIKFMGRIPTVSKMGSMCFENFLICAREKWNFFKDSEGLSFMKMADVVISKETQEWSSNEVERIAEIFKNIDVEGMMHTYAIHGYYQVISDMKEFDYSSEVVQRVVGLLYKYLVEKNIEQELEGKLTPQLWAKYTASSFLCGDIALLNERNYGKDGCLFIAQAIAYYGGYDINEV